MLYGAAGVAHHSGLTRLLLARGADPNLHSLSRDNALPLLEALLDFGADPSLRAPRRDGRSAGVLAARAGRADALELFRRRGFQVELEGDDAFFATLSRADRAKALAFLAAEPQIVAVAQPPGW